MDEHQTPQTASLESWFDGCIRTTSVLEDNEVVVEDDDQFLSRDLSSAIPDVPVSDVTSEIEKLTDEELGLQGSVISGLLEENELSHKEIKDDTTSQQQQEEEEEEEEDDSSESDTPEVGDPLHISAGKEDELERDEIHEDIDAAEEVDKSGRNSVELSPHQENEDSRAGSVDDDDDEELVGETVEEGTWDVDTEEPSDRAEAINGTEDPQQSLEGNQSESDISESAGDIAAEACEAVLGDASTNQALNVEDASLDVPEDDDDETGLKSRFNLRKRSQVHSAAEDYGSDYDDTDSYQMGKRLKLSFSKKNYRRQRPYTNEAVKLAVRMVQSKKMSLLEASREFKIPRTSLHNFVQLYKRGRRTGIRTISPGLTKQEEAEMVSLIMKLSRCGKRYSHNELRYLVQYYLVSNDRPVFKSGTLPTMGWIAGLVERQRELVKAKSKKNTKVAVEDVEEWQQQIEDYLINDWDLDISEMFAHDNGYRVYCFNAFRFLINSPGENAENKPSPIKREPGTEEDKGDLEVGTILGMSADGRYMDPMVIMPEEKRALYEPIEVEDLKIVYSKNGRVDEDVAIQVVKDFDEEIVSKGIPKPVVFFINDKHDLAHFSVIEYCWENQIIVICLPPKTTKTMTPFDISIWPKIRSNYANLWKAAPKNFDNKISVSQFIELFSKAWDSVKVPKQAIRSFVKSGLIPFNVPSILKDSAAEQCDVLFEQNNTVQSQNSSNVLKQVGNQKHSLQSTYNPNSQECSDMQELSPLEERSRGKLEGIEMCLRAIESFIPPDVFPVWNQRGADYRGRCELAFKLWRSVSLLLKAGCAMASIQQMADGFFNPFGADFSSTASFFQKPVGPVTPAPSSSSSRSGSPAVSSASPSIKAEKRVNVKPVQQKMKLKINKSIYSRPKESYANEENSNYASTNSVESQPFVKLYQNSFLPTEAMYEDDEEI